MLESMTIQPTNERMLRYFALKQCWMSRKATYGPAPGTKGVSGDVAILGPCRRDKRELKRTKQQVEQQPEAQIEEALQRDYLRNDEDRVPGLDAVEHPRPPSSLSRLLPAGGPAQACVPCRLPGPRTGTTALGARREAPSLPERPRAWAACQHVRHVRSVAWRQGRGAAPPAGRFLQQLASWHGLGGPGCSQHASPPAWLLPQGRWGCPARPPLCKAPPAQGCAAAGSPRKQLAGSAGLAASGARTESFPTDRSAESLETRPRMGRPPDSSRLVCTGALDGGPPGCARRRRRNFRLRLCRVSGPGVT